MTETWQPLSVLGAILVTRDLLKKTREDDSFIEKMNNGNKFYMRTIIIASALLSFGPTEKAAKYIKACQYFSDIAEDNLLSLIKSSVNSISSGDNVYVFDPREFGTLDFSEVPDPPLPELPDEFEEGNGFGLNDNFN